MDELAGLLPAAAGECAAVLLGHTDIDWRDIGASDLDWSCWHAALHMVDCVYFYAMQVVYGRPDDYLCTELALDKSASPSRLLDALTAHAEMLHSHCANG